MDQLAEYSWSHFCYSPLITHWSAGRAQLVTLLLLSTHHPWISWQSTAGHKLLLLSTHHPCVSWQSTLVTLRLLSTQHPCVTWRSTQATLLLLSTHHPWVNWQGNPHLVETQTINSYKLKSIFYIFYQIL